jgi:hypothetical protein
VPKTRSEMASAFLLGFRRSPWGELTRYWILPGGEEVKLRVVQRGPWWVWECLPGGPDVPRCEGRFYSVEGASLDLWDHIQGGSSVQADRAPRAIRPRGSPGGRA